MRFPSLLVKMDEETVEVERLPDNLKDPKHERIHYGSIAEQEKRRREAGGGQEEKERPAKRRKLSEMETLALSKESLQSRERHARLVAEVERMTRARTVAVPTNDGMVRQRLRQLKEPMTLFGEGVS